MKKDIRNQSTEIHSLSAIEHIMSYRPESILSMRCYAKHSSQRVAQLIDSARAHGITTRADLPPGQTQLSAQLRNYVFAPWRQMIDKLSGPQPSSVLALDHIQDPQNFGAICRTAEALGVDAVFFPASRNPTITSAVYHASAGAIETLPLCQVPNLSECLRRLKQSGFWILGTDLDAKSARVADIPDFDKTALVLGSEGTGLGTLVSKLCDLHVHIEITGKVSSLNVSAAAAILLAELRNKAYRRIAASHSSC